MNENGKMALTVCEMAEELRISKTQAYNLVHIADFPRVRIGTKILIPRKQLEQWLEIKSRTGASVSVGA